MRRPTRSRTLNRGSLAENDLTVPDRTRSVPDRELPDCLVQQPYGSRTVIRKKMADKTYESLKIENIVASGIVAESIDLVRFSENAGNCELNKKRFPGAVYRIPDPKIACLVFSSGKIVLTGIRNHKALSDGLAIVIESLKKVGIEPLKKPRVTITNMVCSYNLG